MDTASAIQAVVFDLDDTLYAEREYVRSGYRAVAACLREARGLDERFEQWLWARFESGRRERAFDALSEHFGLGLTREEIARLVAVYREHSPGIRPYDGAPELLAGLRGRVRLGLLSDGFLPAQDRKLEALGMRGVFDAVVWTEALGRSRECWKPSGAGFEAVAAALGAPHEACAYVADNPAKDFVAPNALAWRTVQLLHAGQLHADSPAPPGGAPQAAARSWDELRSALAL